MKVRTVFTILAVSTFAYVGTRALLSKKLTGEKQPGTTRVAESLPDSERITLLGQLSELEAMMNGIIATTMSREEIKSKMDALTKRLG